MFRTRNVLSAAFLAALCLASALAPAFAAPPDPPTIGIITAGNGEVTVALTPPAFDGGSALTGMTVVSAPADGTDQDANTLAASHVVTGLVNGTPYTFTAFATNADGTSGPSAPSGPVTPDVVPDQLDPPLAQAGNTTASVTISPPLPNGGTAITGYTVTSDPVGGIDASAGTTNLSRVITGLTNGVQYVFTVVATNAAGDSAASLPSYPVRPALPTATITVDSLLDDGVGCTLRKAVENSNGVDAPHPDCVTGGLENTIVFTMNGTIALVIDSLLVTDRPLTIVGNGAASTIIDGDNNVRAFDVCGCQPITLTLRNLTVRRGVSAGGPPVGGGLFVDFGASAKVEDCVFSGNQGDFGGGAIFNAGTLEVTRTTFSNNSTPPGFPMGGAIANIGSLTVSGSTFTGNFSGFGGAIGQEGDTVNGVSLSVANSTFSGNIAGDGGGAIASFDGNAAIVLSHVTVAGNSAGSEGGGGLYNYAGAFSIGSSIVGGNTTAGTGADCFTDLAGIASQGHNVFGTAGCDTAGAGTNDFLGDALLGSLANNGGATQTRKPAPGSPALDRVTCGPVADQRGITRPQGASCDSGAVEIALPGAPTSPLAIGANAQASVTFGAPGSAGDGTITGYTVTSNPAGGTDSNAGTPVTIHVVTGLTNGTAYTFTVRAANPYGEGPSSAATNSVTPATVPGAPTGVSAVAGNAQATVTFTAPASSGGSTITSYTVTSNPGGITASGSGSPLTVTGLTNGTAYTFTVTATNAVGTGSASVASNSVTPAAVPDAPTGVSAVAGIAQAVVSFTAPASTGGAPITSYTVTSSPGSITASGTGSPITVTGLTNGTAYTFTVTATNAAGTGSPSTASNTVTPMPPTFALAVTKTGTGDGTVTSNPAGITCGATCAAPFVSGGSVELTAAAAAGSVFGGWSGACTGTGACNVTMDAAKSVTAAFDSPRRLVNISTRGRVLTGDNVMIGGMIIGGSVNKTVVIRARGPSMVPQGITNPLVNPRLDLYSGQTVIASSDDWGGNANAAAVTASGFAPSEAAEAAILINLAPGPYTAIVSGVGGTTGIGLVEIFEVDHPEVPLVNIATRGRVQTGLDVMIAGFIIQGSGQQTVVVRARGPSLTAHGVPGVLANPTLALVRSSDGVIIASNDNWQTAANAADLTASGFAPSDALEAAILITLDPGAYTAIVRGAGETSGVAIVEVFRN